MRWTRVCWISGTCVVALGVAIVLAGPRSTEGLGTTTSVSGSSSEGIEHDTLPSLDDTRRQSGFAGLQVHVTDAQSGAVVSEVQVGLVRGDGKTVFARGTPPNIEVHSEHPVRSGDRLIALHSRYDVWIGEIGDPEDVVRVDLVPAQDRAWVMQPEGLPPGVPMELMISGVVEGHWTPEFAEIGPKGPVFREDRERVTEFPHEVMLPRGMKTRVYFDAVEGAFPPVGWTAKAGVELPSKFIAGRDIDFRAPECLRAASAVLFTDWATSPGRDGDSTDALAALGARPRAIPLIDDRDLRRLRDVQSLPMQLLVSWVDDGERWLAKPLASNEDYVDLSIVDSARPRASAVTVGPTAGDGPRWVFPGRLDLTTIMWIRDVSTFTETFSRRVPPRSKGGVEVPTAEYYTVFCEEFGVAHVSRDELVAGEAEWLWCPGSISVRVAESNSSVEGEVTFAADWERVGMVKLDGELGRMAVRVTNAHEVTQRGLPLGVYRVRWRVHDAGLERRGMCFVRLTTANPKIEIDATRDR